MNIPKFIFIIPYRDRYSQYLFFKNKMKYILEDIPNVYYNICFIHQNDKRTFNRGAIKNIGFLLIKSIYPNDYKNITLIFNDIDVMPLNKNVLNYETQPGIIKHFYGFEYTLGGIVSINAGDFEKINGFPNYWSWGYEDNMLYLRALKNNIIIDRSVFFNINDKKNIIHFTDSIYRDVNEDDYTRFRNFLNDGLNTIYKIHYTIDNEEYSLNNNDINIYDIYNKYINENGYVFFNINNFIIEHNENLNKKQIYDLRNGKTPFKNKNWKFKNPIISFNLF